MDDGTRGVRIAVVHTGDEWLGRTAELRPAEPHLEGVSLFTEHDRPNTFDEDLARLAEITGLPVVDEHEVRA